MTRTTKRSARRAGFTMVEMLVVVIIVGILLSLTAAAVLKMIPQQQTLNTQSTLTRLQGDLIRAYGSAADKFRTEPIPTGGAMNTVYYNSILPMAGGDQSRARVIWVKLRLKQTFPNNFAEALNPSPMPPLSEYQKKLAALNYTAPLPPNPWESSVCLLWALQRGEGGTAIKESDFGTGSLKDFGQIASNPKDPSIAGLTPNQQPVKGLIDDWGTPLYFCRWPVNSTVLSLSAAQRAHDNNDSDDPSGLLESSSWEMSGGAYSGNANQFMTWCHPLMLPLPTGQAQTYRVYPLIVSAGPDKKLGLDTTTPPPPPTGAGYFATLPTADAKDNLYPALATAR